jgi:hypothetical protein
MLEESVPVDCEPLLNKFLQVAKKHLSLTKIYGNLDEGAWKNPTIYYDVGSGWVHLGNYYLKRTTINYWFMEASKSAKLGKLGVEIPLDVIREEIERRDWHLDGSFEENGRTNVFWDGGTNPTSCVVATTGMICFSREKQFYPWAEIFGGSFVRSFQEDKIGGAVADSWFDGKQYYQNLNDRWVTIAKEDFKMFLMSQKGLSDERHGRTSSELIDALVYVQRHRRVHGAIPALFDPRDVIERDGERFLNISYVKPVQPADVPVKWGEKFPWIASFLDTFFDPPEQLNYFLAWHQRVYLGALGGAMPRGHNVFVCGGVHSGKTLMGLRVVGASLGGSADASEFVVKGSEFNKHLAEKALWRIDDGQVATDANAHRKFSEMVKKLAANPTLNYRKMYADTTNNEWAGRLWVTLNDDKLSLQMMPELSMSIEEKIMVFKAANRPQNYFPPAHELEPMIAAELPFYLRWLMDWTPPAEVMGDARFGIKSYIHKGLREDAMHAGQTGDLLEIIDLWIQRCAPIEEHGKIWKGPVAQWYAEVMGDEALRVTVSRSFTSLRQIARKFAEAARIEGSRIKTIESKHKGQGNLYEIYLNGHTPEPRSSKPFDPAVKEEEVLV